MLSKQLLETMNVACIFLTCNRLDLTLRCINQNFYNAGLDADVILIDNGSLVETFDRIKKAYPFRKVFRFFENKGISAAINKGIALSRGYDAIVTLANDILMPDGWLLNMVHYALKIPNTGMVGIHCVESLPHLSESGIYEVHTPFGNTLITRQALDKVGKFNTDFDPYGQQDADYGFRLNKTGFINYYIPGFKSEHIGHDVGQNSEYRRMKDAGLQKSNAAWNRAQEHYERNQSYFL